MRALKLFRPAEKRKNGPMFRLSRSDRTAASPAVGLSVFSDPDRFAPLHTVATELIEHLTSVYDVRREDGFAVTAELLNAPTAAETVRAVRLTPNDDACAPMVIVLTDFLGVRVYAGALFDEFYPSCGCDACAETWEGCADELRWQTLAIAEGGLAENVSEPRRARWSFSLSRGIEKGMDQTVSWQLRAADGSAESSQQSRAEDVPDDLLARARARLDVLGEASPNGRWMPWPKRDRRAQACDHQSSLPMSEGTSTL